MRIYWDTVIFSYIKEELNIRGRFLNVAEKICIYCNSKHGIRGKNEPGHIVMSSYKVDKGFMVVIEDDGIGFDMNMPHRDFYT